MANNQRTENGIRLHDQHCAWCDCEDFLAVRYGSLHHVSERAARAVKASVADINATGGNHILLYTPVVVVDWFTCDDLRPPNATGQQP